ncbi:hypothetical protein S1361_02610 [Streptomyces cyanogenus]|uniref:Uncharacterized protein n=1 Tax=Streptomyces cyanogenus TaxID=80860 RepID=A0ABX7TK72_STRCY|nr:hypothetical protein S1361_02610 [Streptomyces cyanogenus]
MMCARCDQPIQGKPEPVTIETGSGVSGTVHVCPTPCRPTPRQTYPKQR